MTAELALQVGLSIAAFAVGFALGRVERMTADGKTTRQRWRDIARIGAALVVIAVVVASYWQDRARVECQRDWFVQATESIAARSTEAGRTNHDLRAFADASLAALEQPRQATGPIRDALVELRDSIDRAEAVRQATPIPQPPEC